MKEAAALARVSPATTRRSLPKKPRLAIYDVARD
jgi:hypothetical protein